MKIKRFKWEDRFEKWFDGLSYDAQVCIAISPLVLAAVILITLALMLG